ncbi:methyl-accepting chemotaxis protein 4 [Clostridium puniceum]|uniref:Methyl-accepting chemotaxis protein 4 n=1 Tax=Clostridium puniceum TaxID=29367 RepID=A0A1S8TBY9_9CLOT|nr:methyl-accepting chemotaxis protein [Clostridium puniceum]OOM75256.1 methyl-accepting chemotaxis protein 4 [Clostridium puniceum]
MFKISNKDKIEKIKSSESKVNTEIKSEEKGFLYAKEVFELNSQIQSNIDILVHEEGDMTHGLNTLLKGAEYTTQETEQVNEYLQSLSHNSDKTKKLVDGVVVSLDNSQKEIENAKNEFCDLINQVGSVSQVFEELLNLISDIQQYYNSIQGFATMITGIAKQTNLLSLNASIEAARVGEAGKGFTVVANEIKKLSVDTQENAKDIMNSLQMLTTSMEQLVNKSNEGSGVITKATEIIEGSSSILDRIVDAELGVYKNVAEVQDSQSNNLHGIKEISISLTNLVNKSKAENQQLETIIYGIQKKADCYMHILNNLNQIKILENE